MINIILLPLISEMSVYMLWVLFKVVIKSNVERNGKAFLHKTALQRCGNYEEHGTQRSRRCLTLVTLRHAGFGYVEHF